MKNKDAALVHGVPIARLSSIGATAAKRAHVGHVAAGRLNPTAKQTVEPLNGRKHVK